MYKIRDWYLLFENNRTRELKRMDWVPVPNRMDGSGYTALVDHPNGGAHLGAWLAMLEISSRQKVRGTFPQDSAGLPQVLARMSRLPAGLFEEVLPRLVEIGWIEQVTEIPQLGAEIPQDGAVPSRDTRAVTEGNGMEGNGTTPRELPARVVVESIRKTSPIQTPPDLGISAEELESAWEIHLKHSKDEPQDLAFRVIFGMNGQFDAAKFRARHGPYCDAWSGRWQYCPLTFLGWVRAGMPLADIPKSEKQKAEDDIWKEF